MLLCNCNGAQLFLIVSFKSGFDVIEEQIGFQKLKITIAVINIIILYLRLDGSTLMFVHSTSNVLKGVNSFDGNTLSFSKGVFRG